MEKDSSMNGGIITSPEITKEACRSMLELNPLPSWVIALNDFRFLEVNDLATAHYGYSRQEFLSMTLLDIRPDSEKENFLNADHKPHIQATEYRRGIWKHKKKDGSLLYVEIIGRDVILEGIPARLILANDVTEIHLTGEKLAYSELRLKQAQATAHLGSWELNFGTGLATWSDEACRIYGLDPTDNVYTYEEWFAFVHPDDKDFVAKITEDTSKTLESTSYLHRIKRRDGTVRYIKAETHFEFNSQGIPDGLYGVTLDVTETIHAEQALKKSEENLWTIMNLLPFSIYARDSDGKYTFVNKSLAELFDKEPNDIIGKNVDDIVVNRNLADYFKAHDRQVLEQQKDVPIPDTTFIRPDGSVRYLANIKIPFSPAGSDNVGILGVAIDVTDIKQAEMSLKENAYLLEKAQQVANIGHWVSVPDRSKPTIWSDETYKIFGIDKANGAPDLETFFSLIHPDDKSKVIDGYTKIFERRVNYYDMQNRIVRPDGNVRWIQASAELIPAVAGKPTQIIGVVSDITEDKLREAEKQKVIAELIKRNQDLEQFSYIISHNLRAPVANIIGISDYLGSFELDRSEQEEMTSELSQSAIKLDNVIKDLNHILSVKGENREEKEMVLFQQLVDDIKASIAHLVKESGVSIICNFDEVEKYFTLKSYLYSIFFNLISNSIKYAMHQVVPVVEISSTKTPHGLSLRFKDNGMGINLAKEGKSVFGLYKRFHNHVEGKGMGLFMVKTQVETLGGKISVQSTLNSGTEFLIEFETN